MTWAYLMLRYVCSLTSFVNKEEPTDEQNVCLILAASKLNVQWQYMCTLTLTNRSFAVQHVSNTNRVYMSVEQLYT